MSEPDTADLSDAPGLKELVRDQRDTIVDLDGVSSNHGAGNIEVTVVTVAE